MLRHSTLYYLAASFGFVIHAIASQVPLRAGHQWYSESSEWQLERYTQDDWSFDNAPHPNATDHLVFETAHSLLQQWPNTRMRNGHTIVPGTVPKGTLLYHGSSQHAIPSSPDWVATDPEHSNNFCWEGEVTGGGCWHLTLATTRPLKVVYFDGSSAAKLPYGTTDTQDLVAWGEIGSGGMGDEFARIIDLCAWGKDYGVDGFVRMEMNFELMVCNFTAGMNVVSFSNLVARSVGGTKHPFSPSFEVIYSGSRHNHFPGETRVQLDLSGLVSFYDTELAPSLVAARAGQERWDHRPGLNLSSADLSAAMSRLTEALTRPEGQSSGIDWATLLHVIVDRFAERFELIQRLLNITVSNPEEIINLASKAQTQLRVMITPYALLSATPADPSDETDLDWAIPIFKLCAATHTQPMESMVSSMTASERLLLRAVRGTNREICRTVTRMWAAGVYAGLDAYLNTKESPEIEEVIRVRDAWTGELRRLMSWLDWSIWVKCKPECSAEELCYLPTWPVGFPIPKRDPERRRPKHDVPHYERMVAANASFRTIALERLTEEGWNAFKPASDEWVRPQPKCIRRFEPYDF